MMTINQVKILSSIILVNKKYFDGGIHLFPKDRVIESVCDSISKNLPWAEF
jgi:hypothetical protein